MQAHSELGDTAGAAAVYRRCVAALRQELNVAPSALTQAVFARLTQGAARPAPGNLPHALSSFIGREKEIVEVKRLLATSRLLTVTGPGGSGKTRLALQAAREAAGQSGAGVWWCELAPLSDPALPAAALAEVLGVREAPGRPLTAVLIEHLRSRPLLLVLDICEHLAAAGAQLAVTLLSACPGLRILATSREALQVAGESVWTAPPLWLPAPQRRAAPEELAHYDAIALFMERAAAARPDFTLNPDNAADLVQICRRLDGPPLAIELAAARVTALSVADIAARLTDRLRLLTSGSETTVPRHRTLLAAIDWSFELLSEPERRLFRRLAVFAGASHWPPLPGSSGTLTRRRIRRRRIRRRRPGAAGRTAGVNSDHGREPLELLAALTGLVNESLVEADTLPAGAARYRLLESIRHYAGEQPHDRGRRSQAAPDYEQFLPHPHLASDSEPFRLPSEGDGVRLARTAPRRVPAA